MRRARRRAARVRAWAWLFLFVALTCFAVGFVWQRAELSREAREFRLAEAKSVYEAALRRYIEKRGDLDGARLAFGAVVSRYPDTEYARRAEDFLAAIEGERQARERARTPHLPLDPGEIVVTEPPPEEEGGQGAPRVTTRRAQSAIRAGLVWLAKAQEPDGSWDCKRWDGAGDYKVGMTGLALLAFLGAGLTHTKGQFKDTVSRGLSWLEANQKPNGAFSYQTFYEQGIATLAASEAYGLTRDPTVGRLAQRAIDFIVATQPEHGGFRYGGAVPEGEGDLSVTGWQILALKSGICSELNVPEQAIARSRVFLKNTWRGNGTSSYLVSSQGPGSLAMTSMGMLCRALIAGEAHDDEVDQAARFLLHKELKEGNPVAGGATRELVNDLCYTYYSCLAMSRVGGESWANWRQMYRDPLAQLQVQKRSDEEDRFVRGSWDPEADKKWGRVGGRVYTTALAVMCLEVHYRQVLVPRFE